MAKKRDAHAEAQQRYTDRRKADGWKRKAVWVPPFAVEKFDKYIARQRKAWDKTLAQQKS